MKTIKTKLSLLALFAVLMMALPSCSDDGASSMIICKEMSEGMKNSGNMELMVNKAIEKENTKFLVSFYDRDEAIEQFEDFVEFLEGYIKEQINPGDIKPDAYAILDLQYDHKEIIATEKLTIERKIR